MVGADGFVDASLTPLSLLYLANPNSASLRHSPDAQLHDEIETVFRNQLAYFQHHIRQRSSSEPNAKRNGLVDLYLIRTTATNSFGDSRPLAFNMQLRSASRVSTSATFDVDTASTATTRKRKNAAASRTSRRWSRRVKLILVDAERMVEDGSEANDESDGGDDDDDEWEDETIDSERQSANLNVSERATTPRDHNLFDADDDDLDNEDTFYSLRSVLGKSVYCVEIGENNAHPVELARVHAADFELKPSVKYELNLADTATTNRTQIMQCSAQLLPFLEVNTQAQAHSFAHLHSHIMLIVIILHYLFQMDALVGRIRLHASLDRENCSAYLFYLRASDLIEPSISSLLVLHIVVRDVNDHAPRFQQPVYIFQLNDDDHDHDQIDDDDDDIVYGDEDDDEGNTFELKLIDADLASSVSRLPLSFHIESMSSANLSAAAAAAAAAASTWSCSTWTCWRALLRRRERPLRSPWRRPAATSGRRSRRLMSSTQPL